MLLSIIIPVYNEENTILKILEKISVLPATLNREIIIVDDFSTDSTRDILKNIKDPQIKIFYKDTNTGKGDTLAFGFKESRGDYVIVQDADLEYDPNDYIMLLETALDNPGSVVYGSRFMGEYKDMSILHLIGNKFLTLVTNILFNIKLTDMETCYKLFPGEFIRGIKIESKRFDFEPEITAKIVKNGLKIIEKPIKYESRSFKEGKKITWRDGFHAVATIFKYRYNN